MVSLRWNLLHFRLPVASPVELPDMLCPGGRFLQFNCNGVQHCHAQLQEVLHCHQVLVAYVQETILSMNSTLKEFTGYATIRQWIWHTRPLQGAWPWHGKVLAFEAGLWENIPSASSCPLTVMPSYSTMDIRWCQATSMPTIPPGSSGQEMLVQQLAEATNSSQLETFICPFAFPTRASPPHQISPFWAVISFLI